MKLPSCTEAMIPHVRMILPGCVFAVLHHRQQSHVSCNIVAVWFWLAGQCRSGHCCAQHRQGVTCLPQAEQEPAVWPAFYWMSPMLSGKWVCGDVLMYETIFMTEKDLQMCVKVVDHQVVSIKGCGGWSCVRGHCCGIVRCRACVHRGHEWTPAASRRGSLPSGPAGPLLCGR